LWTVFGWWTSVKIVVLFSSLEAARTVKTEHFSKLHDLLFPRGNDETLFHAIGRTAVLFLFRSSFRHWALVFELMISGDELSISVAQSGQWLASKVLDRAESRRIGLLHSGRNSYRQQLGTLVEIAIPLMSRSCLQAIGVRCWKSVRVVCVTFDVGQLS